MSPRESWDEPSGPSNTSDHKKRNGEADTTPILVGKKWNPDGTPDHSRAAIIEDPEGHLAKGFKQLEERKKAERAKKLAIPEDVQPGSARMVRYQLRNAILVNGEAFDDKYKRNQYDSRRSQLIKKQEAELALLDEVRKEFSVNLIMESSESGEGITAEQAEERASNLTAEEMFDLMQARIDQLEKLQDEEGSSEQVFADVDLIGDELRAARRLQDRLSAETLRSNTN